MKLARESHTEIECFFRYYYQDDRLVLPEVRIYCGRFTKLLINVIGVQGITVGHRIFVRPELITTDSARRPCISGLLATHEITHVLQYRKHGTARFLFNYLKHYWRNLRVRGRLDLTSRQQAYLDILFEIEARETADNFAVWKDWASDGSLRLENRSMKPDRKRTAGRPAPL